MNHAASTVLQNLHQGRALYTVYRCAIDSLFTLTPRRRIHLDLTQFDVAELCDIIKKWILHPSASLSQVSFRSENAARVFVLRIGSEICFGLNYILFTKAIGVTEEMDELMVIRMCRPGLTEALIASPQSAAIFKRKSRVRRQRSPTESTEEVEGERKKRRRRRSEEEKKPTEKVPEDIVPLPDAITVDQIELETALAAGSIMDASHISLPEEEQPRIPPLLIEGPVESLPDTEAMELLISEVIEAEKERVTASQEERDESAMLLMSIMLDTVVAAQNTDRRLAEPKMVDASSRLDVDTYETMLVDSQPAVQPSEILEPVDKMPAVPQPVAEQLPPPQPTAELPAVSPANVDQMPRPQIGRSRRLGSISAALSIAEVAVRMPARKKLRDGKTTRPKEFYMKKINQLNMKPRKTPQSVLTQVDLLIDLYSKMPSTLGFMNLHLSRYNAPITDDTSESDTSEHWDRLAERMENLRQSIMGIQLAEAPLAIEQPALSPRRPNIQVLDAPPPTIDETLAEPRFDETLAEPRFHSTMLEPPMTPSRMHGDITPLLDGTTAGRSSLVVPKIGLHVEVSRDSEVPVGLDTIAPHQPLEAPELLDMDITDMRHAEVGPAVGLDESYLSSSELKPSKERVVHMLCEKMKGTDGPIRFTDICPPGTTLRRTAANVFSHLLNLAAEREVHIKQTAPHDPQHIFIYTHID